MVACSVSSPVVFVGVFPVVVGGIAPRVVVFVVDFKCILGPPAAQGQGKEHEEKGQDDS